MSRVRLGGKVFAHGDAADEGQADMRTMASGGSRSIRRSASIALAAVDIFKPGKVQSQSIQVANVLIIVNDQHSRRHALSSLCH